MTQSDDEEEIPPLDDPARRAILGTATPQLRSASYGVAPPPDISAPPVQAPTLPMPPVGNGPNLARDAASGAVAPPVASDYANSGSKWGNIGRRALGGLVGFGIGLHDPKLGLEEGGDIADPNRVKLAKDTATYDTAQKAGIEAETQDRANAADARAGTTAQSEDDLRKAQTEQAQANTNALTSGAGKTPQENTLHDLMTGDNGKPRINPDTKQPYTYIEAYKATDPTLLAAAARPPTAEQDTARATQLRADLDAGKKLSPEDTAWLKGHTDEKTAGAQFTVNNRVPTEREEWQKDHPGQPIEDYWKAKGVAAADVKNTAGEQAGEAAQQYADDYMKSNKFTGAGDEALMEKYFELAKPSSGFRMTQPQIEMLRNAQDMMNSVVARGKHLFTPEAPYFSNTQRQQIVDTMKNLQSSRDEVKSKDATSKTSGGKQDTATSGGISIQRDANGRITSIQ